MQERDSHPDLTLRTDRWWLEPLIALVGTIIGLGYLTWAAFLNSHYEWGPYISPVYASPWAPSWWKLSPAFILLWIPAGFRLTCYYFRKAYYRAAFGDPASCAVEEPYRKSYTGETVFPFVLNNLHRFFVYLTIAMLFLHWYEFIASLFYNGFYFGLGSIIMFLTGASLTMYVGSCHSIRHIFSAKRSFGCSCSGKIKLGFWGVVSRANIFHDKWSWISLFLIVLADGYVRLLSMGIIPFDPHISLF